MPIQSSEGQPEQKPDPAQAAVVADFVGEADPFDYLNELERHARELSSNPECWMPWNYRGTLATATAPAQTAR